jgi:hypothetical protein
VIRALARVLSNIAAYVREWSRRDDRSRSISADAADTGFDRAEVATAAHDCLNLLTVMVACADAMRRTHPYKRACDDDIMEFHKAADRLERVAQQLISAGPTRYRTWRVIDVNDSILESEGSLRRVLPPGVVLQVQLAAARSAVRANLWEIERILLSLVAHAGRDLPNGSTVFVKTATFPRLPRFFKTPRMSGRPYIRITVAHSGAVLHPHSRPVADFSTRKPADRSLDLDTVSRTVQRLNGALHLESDSGRRMRISVDIPLVVDGSDDERPPV